MLSRWSSESEGGESEGGDGFDKLHGVEESGKTVLLSRRCEGGSALYFIHLLYSHIQKNIRRCTMQAGAKVSVFFDEIRLRFSAGLDVELFGNVSMTWRVQFTPSTLLRYGYFIQPRRVPM
jgi:hypothetical protein